MARSKYGNVKTTRLIGGVETTFDSKAEAKFYDELLIRQRKGEVCMIEVHPSYGLFTNGVKVGTYKADFRFHERNEPRRDDGWRIVVADVKGVRTQLFNLKWNMVRAAHPHLDWRLIPAKSVRAA